MWRTQLIKYKSKWLGLTDEQQKKYDEIEKRLKSKIKKEEEVDDDIRTIRVVLSSELEMYSKFSVISKQKINNEITNYITEQAKYIPLSYDLRISIKLLGNDSGLSNVKKLEQMFKKNIMNSLISYTRDLKRNSKLIISMGFFGLIAMGLSILFSELFYVFAIRELLVIVCWVFIWRAVESYFFARKRIKTQKLKLTQLYLSEFIEED